MVSVCCSAFNKRSRVTISIQTTGQRAINRLESHLFIYLSIYLSTHDGRLLRERIALEAVHIALCVSEGRAWFISF